LGTSDLVFLFNLNEQSGADKQGVLPYKQDLLAWARVQLIDTNSPDREGTKTYFLVNVGSPIPLPADLGPVTDPVNPSDPRWANVHGQITVATAPFDAYNTGDFVHYGPALSGETNVKTLNQNLGANQAAFAAFNQDLNDRLRDSRYDQFQLDLKLSVLSDGYEQLFIQNPGRENVIPEPGTLVIWGVGGLCAAGAAAMGRRRKAGPQKRARWSDETRNAILSVLHADRR
jgi:hypothetical protein